MKLCPGRGRGVGRKTGAEPVAQERIDRPHAQRARVTGLRHGLVVLEQPGQLARREVGVQRQAAAAADLLLIVAEPVQDLL